MATNSDRSNLKPGTRIGWWAVWLLVAYVVMDIITTVVIPLQLSLAPVFGIIMLLCGLSSGIVALIAIVKHHERAVLVWIALLPGVSVLFILFGELVLPLIFPSTAH